MTRAATPCVWTWATPNPSINRYPLQWRSRTSGSSSRSSLPTERRMFAPKERAMPSASAAGPARSRTALRALLLGGSAFCGLALLSAADVARATNILPTQAGINLTTAGAGTLAAKVLSGGAVAPGAVNYTSTGTSATLMLPAQRTLIDWKTFGVGSSNSLTFDFTSGANAIVLNRVPVGASIVIDQGGTVTGQFHNATAGNIWFLADGGVFIHGKVTANGVLATNNRVGIADFDLLNDNAAVLKTALAAASGLIDLSGTVTASGVEIDTAGNIVLTGDIDAGATGSVKLATTGTTRQIGGVVAAGSIEIVSAGSVDLSGALDATSRTGLGGDITVTGRNLTLASASLDASGAAGGGAIHIGGDAHGGGALAQASTASIDAATTIAADATAHGDGGSVVVWSTDNTAFSGEISARGAGLGGKGGAAEVSSHEVLTYAGFTNLTAPGGKVGTLLLDPTDLTIANTATTGVTTTGTSPSPITDTASASPSVLLNSTLNTQLAGSNVTVTTVGSPATAGQTGAITVSAPVSWSTANSLTLNAAGAIALNATIAGSNSGSALVLNSGAAITQTAGGAITVGTLSGASVGGASLTAANLFDTLAGFTNTGVGNLSITDAQHTGLTVTGAVDAGAGNTLSLTTTSGGSLTLSANLSAPAAGGAVNLVSAGTLSQTSGIITTATLSGSSSGGASLTDANAFDTLAGFVNTGSGNLSITDAQATGLTVSAVVDAGNNNTLTLTTTNGGSLTLSANLKATGGPGTVDLVSAGAVSQTTGLITTSTLTGSSVGGASFTTAANNIGTFGPFSDSANGNVTLVDSANLNVTGAVSLGTGTLSLTSTGHIVADTATITAGTLTGSSSGGASFDNTANAIGTFGPFSDSSNGNITVTDGQALTVTGTVSLGNGTLTLNSSGAIAGDTAVITAGTLTGTSAGGASFNNAANAVASFTNFTNATSGDVVLADTGDLATKGLSNTVGSIALTTTGKISQSGGGSGSALVAGLDLILSAGLDIDLGATPSVGRDYIITAATFSGPKTLNPNFSPGRDFTVNALADFTLTTDLTATRNLTVTSTGSLDTTGANLAATGGTLTLQGAAGLSVGSTTATSGATNFSTTAASGNISLQGAVDATGQTLTLNSAGTIDETASAIITASSVTGSSVGGATLAQANLFDTIAGFTNTGVGNVSFTGAKTSGLMVTGALDAGTGNTLTLTASAGPTTETAGVRVRVFPVP